MKQSRETLPATVPGYRIGDQIAEVAWRVPERHPSEPGPWSREADKIAWRGRETGLDCIVRREATGHLGAYVGVGEDHPLFGWRAGAIADPICQTMVVPCMERAIGRRPYKSLTMAVCIGR